MIKPRIYADFHNADIQGRLRLTCTGSIKDVEEQGLTLREGMLLTLYSDDADATGHPDELLVDGVVSFSEDEQCWVAAIDWSAIHHASNQRQTPRSGPTNLLGPEESVLKHS